MIPNLSDIGLFCIRIVNVKRREAGMCPGIFGLSSISRFVDGSHWMAECSNMRVANPSVSGIKAYTDIWMTASGKSPDWLILLW